MDKINTLVDEYQIKIINFHQDNLNEIANLRLLINLSSEYLQLLRLSVRQRGFISESDEISFFKNLKPIVSGHLKYFSHVHTYLMNRPKVSISRQRKYIHLILDKFEAHKSSELEFVKYYRHKSTRYDHIYFVRGLNSIDITNNINHFIDPEFSTSHDDKVAKIMAYDLLVTYYKNELIKLKSQKRISSRHTPPLLTQTFSWTASKTDLVELMYAINATGAVQNGNIDLKVLAEICESLFNIKLGNFYKTYGEIKAREGARTKFLDSLRLSLIKKMDEDNN
ncbi:MULTISPECIES: RteC domain-containing protein [Bizionia]|uniref:Tetracycline regulation of excision, RteC n=1 Tax=Bizionia algoritergicola TaxID=291187 RepID=A0A5D0QXF3_9FLAO|nr:MULTISPECIES: RteC domain-containing protein [Bizionia]OBX23392.1 hypothetical protein BAA08_04885 [Bizionia sp. APA-3]TYB73386.1 hypothetical protein ES675_06915 [Bizionia algoritergicola]